MERLNMESEKCKTLSEEEKEYLRSKLGNHAMNCHHLIWMGRDHHDIVRAELDFQPQMYLPAHNALHQHCPPVPKFDEKLLKVIRAEFVHSGDTLTSLDRLLILINAEHNIKSDYKDLCLHALESQIPYLRGNIDKAKGYHK